VRFLNRPRNSANTMMAGWDDASLEGGVPHRTSPSISCTFFFHLAPSSAFHSLTLRTLLAIDSTSLGVSFLSIAAKINSPLLMVEMSCPSTVTEADLTRWITAELDQHVPVDWVASSILFMAACLVQGVVVGVARERQGICQY
jgi:hypothetical protein